MNPGRRRVYGANIRVLRLSATPSPAFYVVAETTTGQARVATHHPTRENGKKEKGVK